jgi:hypothetical protein
MKKKFVFRQHTALEVAKERVSYMGTSLVKSKLRLVHVSQPSPKTSLGKNMHNQNM